MAATTSRSIAFSMPGGDLCVPSQARPVDLVHLARQTMGDRELEQEILQLFIQQAKTINERIGAADVSERKRLAHGLKGSARGIGAFGVAECAAAIEEFPSKVDLLTELANRIDAVRDFIAAISR